MFYLRRNWRIENKYSLLNSILFSASVLTVAGFFSHAVTVFRISGAVCTIAVIVNMVTVFRSIHSLRRLSYVFYCAIFLPLLGIGYLISNSILSGIWICLGFIGFVSSIVAWAKIYINDRVLRETDSWLEKQFGEDDNKVKDELVPILLDENVEYEPDRIKAMSVAYKRMTEVYSPLGKSLQVLDANRATMDSLMRYETSGLRQKDMELDESGEIYVQYEYSDVLEEGNISELMSDAEVINSRLK